VVVAVVLAPVGSRGRCHHLSSPAAPGLRDRASIGPRHGGSALLSRLSFAGFSDSRSKVRAASSVLGVVTVSGPSPPVAVPVVPMVGVVVAVLHGCHHLLQGVPSGGRGGACLPDGVVPLWPRSCVFFCARCPLPKGPGVRAALGA